EPGVRETQPETGTSTETPLESSTSLREAAAVHESSAQDFALAASEYIGEGVLPNPALGTPIAADLTSEDEFMERAGDDRAPDGLSGTALPEAHAAVAEDVSTCTITELAPSLAATEQVDVERFTFIEKACVDTPATEIELPRIVI